MELRVRNMEVGRYVGVEIEAELELHLTTEVITFPAFARPFTPSRLNSICKFSMTRTLKLLKIAKATVPRVMICLMKGEY